MMSGDTRYLSKEFLIEFIELYKQHTALWKLKSKEYSNKALKNAGYDALVQLCRKVNSEANRDFVCKKIQSLRGSFRKEYKKVQRSKRSGGAPYVPSLWYYDLLYFTVDQDVSNSMDNDSENDYISETDREDDRSLDALDKESHSKMSLGASTSFHPSDRKRIKRENGTVELYNNYCAPARSTINTISKEFEAVGINVAAKLQKMSHWQQIFAELLINKVISRGLLGTLTEATDLAEGPSVVYQRRPLSPARYSSDGSSASNISLGQLATENDREN